MPKLISVGTKNHLVLAHVYDFLRRHTTDLKTLIHEENWPARKLVLKDPAEEVLESLKYLRVTLEEVG